MDKLEFAENAAPNDQPGDDSPVQLLDATILRGFNVYHRDTVIRQTVDIGSLHGMRSGQFGPNFGARFTDCFRALRQKVPGDDFSEDFLARLNDPDGVSFEEALLEAIIAIETSFAFERGDLEAIAFRTIESGEAHRQVALIWSSAVMRHSRVAAEIGLGSLAALLPDDLRAAYTTDTDALESTFEAAQKEARRRRPPANTAALILAAKQRGIPCESLGGSRLRLGEGSSQHHIFSSAMSKTALWTNRLSDDKRYMRRRLSELGLPVVRQLKVATVEAARQATQRLGGYRVLVRPLDQRTGKGKAPVTTSIDDIDKAFDAVAEPGTGAVVESLPDGNSYNLLVVGGQVIATARLMPPIIEGDGKRTIEQLVHDLNDDSFRDGFRMRKVTVDERLAVYLSGLGNELDDVLAAGEVVALRPHATIATGGVAVDVSDQIHPDNLDMAVRAAEAFELDVAGVEFITSDIGLSHKEVGGTILDVSPTADLRCHVWPRHGRPQDVAGAILERSLPAGTTGHVPSLLVAGDRGTGLVAREIDSMLRGAGKSVGLVTRHATFMNGEPLAIEGSQRRKSIRGVLGDPRVETLVSSISLRQAVKRGLQVDHCEVAAIMNRSVDGDADLFKQGIRLLVEATSGRLVVGANNAVALAAIEGLDTDRLIMVSPRLRGEVIERHLAIGGAAVVNFWSDQRDRIVLFDKDQVVLSIASGLPQGRSAGRTDRRQIEAKMFAIALAYGMGMAGHEIDEAIENAPPHVTAKLHEEPEEMPAAAAD